MANLVPLKSVVVVRKGARVSPPIGKAFPFEDEEVEAMKEGVHYRKAVNEDAEADEADLKPLGRSPHVGKPKTNAQGAGKTTAMTDGNDGTTRTGEQQTDERLDGSVDDLKTLLAGITDKADLASLKAAETAGKNRTGAVQAIDARIAALTTDDDL